jgi:CRISPR-associated protein Csb1
VELNIDSLLASCGDDASDAGILITATLEPLAGPGAPVKPAVYAGGRYQEDERWVGEGEQRRVSRVVVIDNVPSEANRLELGLTKIGPEVGLPEIVLDLSGVGELPPHLPRRISGFQFPHRQADAYLRDSLLDGEPFPSTEIGKSLLSATADEPAALFEWFPQALLFGFWQSHLGKKGSHAKLARSWVSEIVGINPGTTTTRTLGIKGDPLNLSVSEQIQYDEDDQTDWQFLEGTKKAGGTKKQESLAEIGHGQVPFRTGQEALAAISFEGVVQRSTVSFAGLRHIWCGSAKSNAAGRALLAAIGLLGHVAAFGRAFSLRSGCDLRPVEVRWCFLGGETDQEMTALGIADAKVLFADAVRAAEASGLPVGRRWASTPLVLTPSVQLAKAIRATYPTGE